MLRSSRHQAHWRRRFLAWYRSLTVIFTVGAVAASCAVADGTAHEQHPIARMSGESRAAKTVDTRKALLAPCSEPLAMTFSSRSLVAPAEGARRFVPAGAKQRTALDSALYEVGRRAWRAARVHADVAGYRLCAAGDVVVLTPQERRSTRARIALRLGEARPVVFEAPHPFHDRGTAEQGFALFERLGARALVVSGTYRCDSGGVASGHPGHTHACGGSQPYAVSDMAHTVDSIFHQAHVTLHRQYDRARFVSLHGMAQRGVSVSDGTRLPLRGRGGAEAPVARLTRELRRSLPSETVTTCNAHASAAARYRLCGTTNVQGRHVNGYSGSSVVEPLRATGRFIHIEQSFAVRQDLDAVASAFERWLRG